MESKNRNYFELVEHSKLKICYQLLLSDSMKKLNEFQEFMKENREWFSGES